MELEQVCGASGGAGGRWLCTDRYDGASGPRHLPYAAGVRVLATMAVILIHSVPAEWAKLTAGTAESGLFVVATTWTRWCVPVFFMLSGALLLDEQRIEPARQFYVRRAIRVGFPTLVWSVIYVVYFNWGEWQATTVTRVLAAFISGRPAGHLWFVYALTGLYLATPVLRKVFSRSSAEEQRLIAYGTLILASLSVLCWTILGRIRWQTPPDPVFVIEWIPYLGYFLCGRVLRDCRLTSVGASVALGVLIGIWSLESVGLAVLTVSGEQIRGEGLFANYLSPLNVLQSVVVFVLMATWFRGCVFEGSVFRTLGDATFGAYLVHTLVLEVIESRLGAIRWDAWSVIGLWAATVSGSMAFGMMSRQVPVLRRCVGA